MTSHRCNVANLTAKHVQQTRMTGCGERYYSYSVAFYVLGISVVPLIWRQLAFSATETSSQPQLEPQLASLARNPLCSACLLLRQWREA